MPGGYTVSLTGGQVDLSSTIEVLTEATRILKKSQNQGISLASQVKVFRDLAKGHQ